MYFALKSCYFPAGRSYDSLLCVLLSYSKVAIKNDRAGLKTALPEMRTASRFGATSGVQLGNKSAQPSANSTTAQILVTTLPPSRWLPKTFRALVSPKSFEHKFLYQLGLQAFFHHADLRRGLHAHVKKSEKSSVNTSTTPILAEGCVDMIESGKSPQLFDINLSEGRARAKQSSAFSHQPRRSSHRVARA